MPFQFTCEHCGKSFTRINRRNGTSRPHKFCSLACRDAPRSGISQDDGTVLIPLTQDKFAVVDADDAPALLKYRWFLSPQGYAVRNGRIADGGRGVFFMHRVILGLGPDEQADHRDRNRLNNRKSNLRAATTWQNAANKSLSRRNSSGFHGVHWRASKSRWYAKITYHGKERFLGSFRELHDAARAYDTAAIDLYGEFATLNFPEEHP